MASIKDLKKRIGSVKNTQQTTRAMKMVSAAKLRRAQEAIQNQRPYAKRIGDLIREVSQGLSGTEKYPLIRREKPADGTDSKKVLVVLVTSDRGLCGGFNGNALKACQKWILANQNGAEIELAFVGRKGYEFFKNKKVKLGTYFSEAGGKVSFAKANVVATALVEKYLNADVDEVKFIYNEFKNAVTQKVVVEDFLPLLGDSSTETASAASPASAPDFIIKPSKQDVLVSLLEKNFAIQTFRILLESQAGEHGARMSAMENATKNAGEMIKKLTLLYNKQRQAGITKELLEIISQMPLAELNIRVPISFIALSNPAIKS